MTPGDQVYVYTHEKSDDTHTTKGKVGIVLSSFEDPIRGEVLRVKVLEWGTAPYDLEVAEFPAKAPVDALGNPIYGGTYYRSLDGSDPDFESLYGEAENEVEEVQDPAYEQEAEALRAKQALAEAKAKTQPERDALAKRHTKEWEDFDSKWESQMALKPARPPHAADPLTHPSPQELDEALARRPPPTVSNSLPKL